MITKLELYFFFFFCIICCGYKSSIVCWRKYFSSCLFCHGRLKSPQFVCYRNSDMWQLSLLLGVVLLQSHSLACRMYVFVCFVKPSQNFPRYTKVHFRWWFVTPHLKSEATSWIPSLLHLRWNYQALATVETEKWQPGGVKPITGFMTCHATGDF